MSGTHDFGIYCHTPYRFGYEAPFFKLFKINTYFTALKKSIIINRESTVFVTSSAIKDVCEPVAVSVVIITDCTATWKSVVNKPHCAVAETFVAVNMDCTAAESLLTSTGTV